MGRLHQTGDEFFPAVGRGVGDISVDIGWRGREAGEVEENAADESVIIRGRRGFEAIGFQAFCDEVIHRIRGGGPRFLRRNKSPVRLVFRAVSDPFFQLGDLLRLERGHVRFRRRHHHIGIFG